MAVSLTRQQIESENWIAEKDGISSVEESEVGGTFKWTYKKRQTGIKMEQRRKNKTFHKVEFTCCINP